MPRKKLTRDEASKDFAAALDFTLANDDSDAFIARKSARELRDGEQTLFSVMMAQWRRRKQTVQVQSEGDKTATVIVENDPKSTPRPLVLIEENGS